MPSLFRDVEYYKRQAKQSRERLVAMGIKTDLNISEMVIDESSKHYAWLFPHYDLVKDEFAPIIQKLNEEIKEHITSYKELCKLETFNSKIDLDIKQGFASRLKRTPKENEKTGEEYEQFIFSNFEEVSEQLSQNDQLANQLASQVNEWRSSVEEIDRKCFLSKYLHKKQFALRKAKAYEKLDELNKLQEKNQCDLVTLKIHMTYYSKEVEALAMVNNPLENPRDFVRRYLFLNKKLHIAKYYADKTNELEQLINTLSAKDRFAISQLLQEHYLSHKHTYNNTDEYNYLDLHYMIYSLADGAAKEGSFEAQKFIEETLIQISVEKDERRMMRPELNSEIKSNLSIIHALDFYGNEVASALLKSILAFRVPKLSQISSKTYDAYINGSDIFENRKNKIADDILVAAEKKRKEIEAQKYIERLKEPLSITYGSELADIEIVYVPPVDGM